MGIGEAFLADLHGNVLFDVLAGVFADRANRHLAAERNGDTGRSQRVIQASLGASRELYGRNARICAEGEFDGILSNYSTIVSYYHYIK